MKKLIALARHGLARFSGSRLNRPDKQVNKVLAPLVNQSRHRPAFQIIKPASNERKTFAGKVHHGGRKIEFPVEPWFDGMLIGGGDVSEMAQP